MLLRRHLRTWSMLTFGSSARCVVIVASLFFAISENAIAQERNPTAEKHFREALEARKKRDFDAAIAKATQALDSDSKYVDAYQLRADAYTQQLRYDQALADCNAALAINPTKVRIRLMRAIALAETGNPSDAVKEYDALIDNDEAAKLHPRFYRGLAFIKLGRKAEAIADLEAEIDTHRTRLPLLGDLLSEDKQYKKAVRCYTLAINDIFRAIAPREGETSIERWARPKDEEENYGQQQSEPEWEGPQAFFEQQRSIREAAEQQQLRSEEEYSRPSSEVESIGLLAHQIEKVKERALLAKLYSARAVALINLDSIVEASRDFNEALLFTEDPETLRKSAVTALRAKSVAVQGASFPPGAVSRLIEALNTQIASEGEPSDLLRLKAMLAVASGDDNAALDAFNAILAKEQTDVIVLRMAAECALRLKDYRRAGFACNCLVKMSVADERIYEIRAISYQGVNQRDRAIADLLECMRLVSSDYQFIAQLHVGSEKEKEARLVIERATAEIDARTPLGGEPYFRRAEAYMVVGDFRNALADCKRAAKLSSPGAFARDIGRCHLELKEYPAAIRAFNDGVDTSYANGCLFGRAQAHAGMKNYEKAINDFESAMKDDPKNAAIYGELARTFLATGDLKRAIQVTEAARDLNHRDGLDEASLAAVYSANKDFKEAARLQYIALKQSLQLEQAIDNARLLSAFLVDAADAELWTNLLGRLRAEAEQTRSTHEHFQTQERERQKAREEAEKNRNPYKDLSE